MSAHGESGIILANLAKVYDHKGDHPRAMETLWHALELDPNQENGLGWYEQIHREKDGPEGGLAALERIRALLRELARAALAGLAPPCRRGSWSPRCRFTRRAFPARARRRPAICSCR